VLCENINFDLYLIFNYSFADLGSWT